MKFPYYTIIRSFIYSNRSFFKNFYKIFYLFLIILVVFDSIATFHSAWLGWFAFELNPLVRQITPFGALSLNIIILYFMRKYSIYNMFIVFVLFIFYGSACINHFYVYMEAFADWYLQAYYLS